MNRLPPFWSKAVPVAKVGRSSHHSEQAAGSASIRPGAGSIEPPFSENSLGSPMKGANLRKLVRCRLPGEVKVHRYAARLMLAANF